MPVEEGEGERVVTRTQCASSAIWRDFRATSSFEELKLCLNIQINRTNGPALNVRGNYAKYEEL